MTNNDRSIKFLSFVAAILLFLLLRPFFTWSFALNKQVNFFFSASLFLLFITQRKKMSFREFGLAVFLVITVLFYSIRSGSNLLGVLALLFIVPIPFADDDFFKKVFEYFIKIYCVIVGLSLVSWILVLFGVFHPIGMITSLDNTKVGIYSTYLIYPLCVSQGIDIRFYGPFDEPGVVGTLSAILLFCNGVKLKDFKSVVLLLTGLFSLSLFFYIIVSVYLILSGSLQKRGKMSALIVLSIFVGLFYITRENDTMREVIWDRFLWDEERNTIMGEDRMGENVDAFNSIRGTSEYWFGVENKDLYLSKVEGSSSYKNVIALNGMVFFIPYLLFFIVLGLIYKRHYVSFILYIMVFGATIYQRPGLFSFVWFFLFSYMARIDIMMEEKKIIV